MPTYVTLISYTQQGAQQMKESPERVEKAKAAMRAAGGEMKAFYLTMGQYDAVTISEMPSDEAYATTLLAIAARGNVRTETLRAFTEEEYGRIIANLP